MNNKLLDIFFSVLTSDRMNWERTWNSTANAHNPFTKTVYHGFNFYLNYIGNRFATFNQISAAKWKVKRGAKGLPVLYSIFEEVEENGKKVSEYRGQRYYLVFDLDTDVEWLPIEEKVNDDSYKPFELLDLYREREWIGIELWEPAYAPIRDVIKMPKQSDFISYMEYQSVYAHECVHSTGHEKRLKRPLLEHRYWSTGYAQEELVAEIGAVMLTGNNVSNNTKAYVQSWITDAAKEKDAQRTEIYKAFQKARDAVQFIQSPLKAEATNE